MPNQNITAVVDYEVTKAREIGGVHRSAGEIVTMTPGQAKYYLSPYGSGLKNPGPRQEMVGSLDDPKVRNPEEHVIGKLGKAKV